jgi:transposase InsO family protein
VARPSEVDETTTEDGRQRETKTPVTGTRRASALIPRTRDHNYDFWRSSSSRASLTAVDTATRYAIGALVAGDKSARDAAAFVDHVAQRLDGIGIELAGVLTDNGPEFTGRSFTSHLEDLKISHRRIPPRSPNHNAVCERFQGTALQEFYRPAFHRQHFARLADLNAQFQGWLQTYNTRRRNHGDFMRGRTPFAVMEAHLS